MLVFEDGILIRYDRKPNTELKVFVGLPHETLTELAPGLSESFLHCPTDTSLYDPGDKCITLTLSTSLADGGDASEFSKLRIFAVAPSPPQSPDDESGANFHRPIPRISVRNEFDLILDGEASQEDGRSGRRFVLRSRIRLPLGWEAIELFPPFRSEAWNPSVARSWAETDLLAATLRRNLLDDRFRALDPHAEARKRFSQRLAQLSTMLDGPEEELHQFLKANPHLLCPTHVRLWSKLPLGKRVTDFVFRDASGDYLLVELERATHQLFRRDGQVREPITHAMDEVTDWLRYLEDNLTTVQRELGLEGISTNPHCLVVIGRRASLSPEDARKLITIQNQIPRLKIMTYDDVLERAKASVENLIGPLWDAGPNAELYVLPN